MFVHTKQCITNEVRVAIVHSSAGYTQLQKQQWNFERNCLNIYKKAVFFYN